jgi:hypothetical protein
MKKSLGLRNSSHPQQGIALVTVLILLVMITGLITVSTLLALGNRGSSTDTIYATKAQNLAEAGIENALDSVFYETYRRWVISGEGGVGVKFDLCAFKKWLTGYWGGSNITAQKDTTKLAANGTSTCIYTGATNAALPNNASGTLVNKASLPTLLNNITVSLPDISLGGTDTVSVDVTRVDTGSDVALTFTAKSKIMNGTTEVTGKQVSRTMRLAGSPFPGDEFALLTNDINCSFCHLQIDNMKRVYADSASTELFKRVKLGALSSINFNALGHKNDTLIAGTLYSRGGAAPAAGDEVYFSHWADGANPGLLKAGTNKAVYDLGVTKYAAVSDNAYDPAISPSDVKAIDATAAGVKAFGKIYYKYPIGSGGPDGVVPDKFPTIINDANNDKLISDAEWTSYLSGAPRGTLEATGAIVYGVKRPGSVKVQSDIPISFDPVGSNPVSGSSPYLGSRLGDKLLAGFWNSGVAGKAIGATMDLTMLRGDIAALNTATQAACPRAVGACTPAQIPVLAAVEANFVTQWRGWLIQQALASPNNRDLRPTNATADLAIAADLFVAINPPFAANDPGRVLNNFWTAYNPANSTMYLAYCRVDPCKILNGATNAFPESPDGTLDKTIRNANILPGGSTLSSDIALLAIPFAATDIFPTKSNTAKDEVLSGTTSGISGYFDGNLIVDAGLIGDKDTNQKFVSVTGTVHVNGDLVIRGQVKGEGRFIVRGNVYIVGDLVYGCATSACLTKDGTNPSYSKPEGLPKLAILAGGSIIVGDYDSPDFRANRNQLNLINDQVGQARLPTGTPTATNVAAAPVAATQASWMLQTVPGATGTNMLQTNGGNMGFAPMMASFGNNHSNVRFASAPFGFLVKRNGGFGPYESGGTAIGATELATGAAAPDPSIYSIQTLYPSNGPILTGDRANSGFSVAPVAAGLISNTNLGCINAPAQLPNIPAVFDATVPPTPYALNSGFWCPPSDGKYIRNWDTTGVSPTDTNTTTWMSQPPQNAGLDGVGMTTGWLGGLLRVDQGSVGFDGLGDLSQTKLLKIMWLATMESGADRDPNIAADQTVAPLRTDGLLYSPNSLFCVARFYEDQRNGTRSSTQGRWIHHGSLLSFELGFLLTGNVNNSASVFTANRADAIDLSPGLSADSYNKGPAMGVFYDERLSGILGLTGSTLEIRRTGIYTQAGR